MDGAWKNAPVFVRGLKLYVDLVPTVLSAVDNVSPFGVDHQPAFERDQTFRTDHDIRYIIYPGNVVILSQNPNNALEDYCRDGIGRDHHIFRAFR